MRNAKQLSPYKLGRIDLTRRMVSVIAVPREFIAMSKQTVGIKLRNVCLQCIGSELSIRNGA